METADSGRLRFDTTPLGTIVSLDGRRLTGADPEASCGRRLPQGVEPQTLVIVNSPLLCYGLNGFLESLPRSAAVLLVELDPVLADLPFRRESQLAPRTAVRKSLRVVASFSDALQAANELIAACGIRRTTAVHLTGGAQRNRADYQKLQDTIQSLIQNYWTNRGTQIRLGRRWVSNLFRNVIIESRDLNELGALLRHRTGPTDTVVLAGAGPELDSHLDLLRTVRHDVPVVVLDTALPAFAAAGIIPDGVFSMDGQLANAYDFLPWCWDEVVLIADVTVHPSIPRRFRPDHRAFFASRFGAPDLLESPVIGTIPVVPPRGSVAPAAMDLLVRCLAFRTVITVAIDFWYRIPRSHASLSMPSRRLYTDMTRRRHNDGYEQLYSRPRRPAVLRDGRRVQGDAILVNQAEQMKEVVTKLLRADPDLQLVSLPGDGLDIGTLAITDHQMVEIAGRSGRVQVRSCDTHSPPVERVLREHPEQREHETRRASMQSLVHRLREQEGHLEGSPEGPIFFDASLTFALMDLPQWPLLGLAQDWFQLHRSAILRSVRDYRRRLERALRIPSSPRVTP